VALKKIQESSKFDEINSPNTFSFKTPKLHVFRIFEVQKRKNYVKTIIKYRCFPPLLSLFPASQLEDIDSYRTQVPRSEAPEIRSFAGHSRVLSALD